MENGEWGRLNGLGLDGVLDDVVEHRQLAVLNKAERYLQPEWTQESRHAAGTHVYRSRNTSILQNGQQEALRQAFPKGLESA